MSEKKLTIKQEKFVQKYFELGVGADAYRHAYDSANMAETTIHEKSCLLLKYPHIVKRLAELAEDHLERHRVTVDRVIAEYSRLAFANMLDYVTIGNDGLPVTDFSKLDRKKAAAIAEIKIDQIRMKSADGDAQPPMVEKVTFKLASKQAALDSLAKFLGMFIDRAEVTGKDGKDLIPTEPNTRDLARTILGLLRQAKIDQSSEDEDLPSEVSPASVPASAGHGAHRAMSLADAPFEEPKARRFNPASGKLEDVND